MDIILPFSFRLFVCLFVLFCCVCFLFFHSHCANSKSYFPAESCHFNLSQPAEQALVFRVYLCILFQASKGKSETRQGTRDTRGEGKNEYDNSVKPSFKKVFSVRPRPLHFFVTASFLRPLLLIASAGYLWLNFSIIIPTFFLTTSEKIPLQSKKSHFPGSCHFSPSQPAKQVFFFVLFCFFFRRARVRKKRGKERKQA